MMNLQAISVRQHINASQFAYKCVYGELPSFGLYGRYASNHKEYKGLLLDAELKDSWLDELNNIPNIEIRSTCAGHDFKRVTHIIFKPANQDTEYLDSVCSKLNNKDTKCIYDIGNNGFYRVCVATKKWYTPQSNAAWEKWWNTIPKLIKKAVRR